MEKICLRTGTGTQSVTEESLIVLTDIPVNKYFKAALNFGYLPVGLIFKNGSREVELRAELRREGFYLAFKKDSVEVGHQDIEGRDFVEVFRYISEFLASK